LNFDIKSRSFFGGQCSQNAVIPRRGLAGAVMDNRRIREELAPALLKLYVVIDGLKQIDVSLRLCAVFRTRNLGMQIVTL
jgi:hypothetical protein